MKKAIVMLLAAVLNVGVLPPLARAQDKEPAAEEKKHKPSRAERRAERREAKRQAREERRERQRERREGHNKAEDK